MSLRRSLRLYARLQLMHLRIHLEYRADFLIGLLGVGLQQLAWLALPWAVFSRFPQVAGWALWEVMLIWGLVLVPRGVVELLADGPWMLRQLVHDGSFDRVLVRPVSPLLQVLTQAASTHGLANVVLGVVLIARSSAQGGLPWTPGRLAFLVLALASGSLVVGALNLVTNSIVFWDRGATTSVPVLALTALDFARLPLDIFGSVVRALLTYLVPFAFVGYLPACVLAGRHTSPEGLGLLSPLAGPAAVGVAALIWRRALGRYESSGH